jgi:predicted Zn-dependent peptidase
MPFKRKALTVLISAACLSAITAAETRIADNLKHFTLDNGMTIFVYPRKDAPVFCGMIYVNAGSAEENAGDTGLAHLLEHMAFKGTPWIGTTDWAKERPILAEIEKTGSAIVLENAKQQPDQQKIESLNAKLQQLQEEAAQFIVPNQYDQIITRAGGTGVNASTSVDFTNYYMTLPSNQLELWAMMESERLLYPSWREFYKERDVVAEERRMRSEDNPDGKMYETYLTTSFTAHPYRNPTIGWMSDIYNLTIEKTDAFYRKWYVPENFVAVLVGDVDPEQVRQTLDKYFGGIPAAASPPLASTKEPRQMGERRTQVEFDAQPQMIVGWHKPTFPEKDAYVIEVIQYLLTRTGRSSRLYERLVKKEGICQEVESFTAPGDKYPNTFAVHMVPRAPHSNAEAERALYEEIERIKREPVPDQELEKIRNQIDANFIKDLENNNGFARQLGYQFLITRDPNVLDNLREELKKVTAQDIMRVAQKYLVKENRNVVELVKAPARPAQSGRPQAPVEIRPNDTATSASEAVQTQENAQ